MSYSAKRSKRMLAGVLAAAMALTVTPILGFTGTAGAAHLETADPVGEGNVCEGAPEEDPFTDVGDNDPAVDEIRCMVNAEPAITQGKTATTYEPNSFVQRRQMALFLQRVADLAEDHETSEDAVQELPADDGESAFTDIGDETADHQQAIRRLEDSGVTEGVTATEFRPGDNVSRRQMAKFLVRLQNFLAGEDFDFPTVNDCDDCFNDDDGDSGEAELNILAREGVFIGTGGEEDQHNVSPGDFITRRQMAFVLTRKLEVLFEAGLINRLFEDVTAGQCGIVTSEGAGTYTFTDEDTGEQVTVMHDATNDAFTVDGASASRAAFDAATTVGDEVCFVDDPTTGDADADEHHLTNVSGASRTSGVIGNIDTTANEFVIIEPVSGVAISDVKNYTGGVFFVDGAVVNEAGFEAALNEGDTVIIETDEADNQTFRITNQTVSGEVSFEDEAEDEVRIDNLGDNPLTAQDANYDYVEGATTNNYFVDGSSATLIEFEEALTVGDELEYTRAGDVQTFRLTNVAPPEESGDLTETFDTTADTATLVDGADDVNIDYSAIEVFRVDGSVVTEDEFEDNMTAGDDISHQPDDPDTAGDQGFISLTNDTLEGLIDEADTTNDTYDVDNAQDGVIYDALDYTAAVFGGADRYFVNGEDVNLTEFEAFLDEVAADPTPDDTIEVVDNNSGAGADISTDHRLTTDETIT